MALIAPDIARFTTNGTYLGRPTANVLDVFFTVIGGSDDRAAGCENIAGRIAAAWTFEILPNLSNALTIDSVSWVDLDSASGSVGTTTALVPDVGNLPSTGDLTGEPYAASVAGLVTKSATAARGQRQGKWFLPGLTEAYVTGNTLTSGYVNDMNAGLAEFMDRLTLVNIDPFTLVAPVVVHTTNTGTPEDPVIEFAGSSLIQSMTLAQRVASQRRRNRG